MFLLDKLANCLPCWGNANNYVKNCEIKINNNNREKKIKKNESKNNDISNSYNQYTIGNEKIEEKINNINYAIKLNNDSSNEKTDKIINNFISNNNIISKSCNLDTLDNEKNRTNDISRRVQQKSDDENQIEIKKNKKYYEEQIKEIKKEKEQNIKQFQEQIRKQKQENFLKLKEFQEHIEKLKQEYEHKINQFNQLNTKNISEIKEFSKQNNQLNRELLLKNQEIDKYKKELIIMKKQLEELKSKLSAEKKTILRGLNNIGATCYMNATLQCLSNTQKLTEFFLKKYKDKRENLMANEYHKLIINLWDKSKNNTPYSPDSFKQVLSKENPLFAGIAANDSKDLINFLLERFHKELNQIYPNSIINNNIQQDQTNEQGMLNLFLQEFKDKFNSPISNLFYGIMETKSQCYGCKIIKYNFQVYSFVEFPLQEVNRYCFNNGRRPLLKNDRTNPDVDLYECFEYYGKIDLMNGDNQMYCNICNKLNNALYSTIIYSAPNILIINLNRGKGAVYECQVNFPEQLNLFNFVSFKNGNTVFELYAVICHLGPSSMSGHFVVYCKNIDDNKWYLYNDGLVSKCTRQYQYREGMPYILFYRVLKSS